MKTLLIAMAMLVSANAFAGAKVPNCFTEKNVKKGQFIIMMNENLNFNESSLVGHQIGLLGLAQMSNGGGHSMILAEPAYPMNELSRRQQATIINGLQDLVDAGGIDIVTCNGLMKAL